MPPPRPSRRERRGAGAPPRALRGPPRSVVGVAAPYPLLPPTSILAFTAAAGVARPVGGAVTAAATPTTSAAVVRRGGGGGRCRPWCGGLAAARRPAGAAALPCLRGTTGTAWAGGAVTPAAPRRRLLRVSPAGGDAVPSRGLPPPPPGLSWVVVVCAATGGEGGGPPAAPTPSGRGPDGDAAAGAAAPTPTANADSAAVTTDAAAVDGAPRPWWAPIAPLWAAFKRAGFVVGLATGLAVSGVVLFAPEGGGADGAGVAAVREKTTLFEYILTDLQRGYVEEVDMDALFEAGVEGMLGTLDPYTSFESVAEARELSLKTAGKYVWSGGRHGLPWFCCLGGVRRGCKGEPSLRVGWGGIPRSRPRWERTLAMASGSARAAVGVLVTGVCVGLGYPPGGRDRAGVFDACRGGGWSVAVPFLTTGSFLVMVLI